MTGRDDTLALILAGGLGRRMGGLQKPFQLLGDLRLIDRVIAAARAQCRVVALNLADLAPETRAVFEPLGLPLLADALPGRAGPLAGVLAGLEFAATQGLVHVLSLPCDCPFLPDDLAARLHEAARDSAQGLAIAASGGRLHPVVALWPVRLAGELRRALTMEDQRRVGGFQDRFSPARVDWPVLPRDPFFNVNTPDDLKKARDMLAEEQAR